MVGVFEVELFFNGISSLKEKRRIVKSIIEKTKNRFNVSIAETGKQEAWQLAKIGIAFVGNEKNYVLQMLDSVERYLENMEKAELINIEKVIY
jgi:uncharacterized protein YlxP (DUF503 family)